MHIYFVILLEIQSGKRWCTSEFVGAWWLSRQPSPRFFISTFKHRTSWLGCLCTLCLAIQVRYWYQYVSRAFPHLATAGGRRYILRMIYFPENIIVRHRLLSFARVYTRALYIYIRKPSICWIFTTDCPVKRLCSSNILERGCSDETWT